GDAHRIFRIAPHDELRLRERIGGRELLEVRRVEENETGPGLAVGPLRRDFVTLVRGRHARSVPHHHARRGYTIGPCGSSPSCCSRHAAAPRNREEWTALPKRPRTAEDRRMRRRTPPRTAARKRGRSARTASRTAAR